MQTPPTEKNSGLGATARLVAEHVSSLFRLELELAQLEVKKKVTNLGVGIGLAVAAAVFAFYGLGFLFATIAAGLATAMSTWLAILIVTLGLFLVAAILGLIAKSRIEKGTPPIPEQAILEAKLTTEAIKSDGD
jgi:Putative Actinobacterial Holin-X, holin superfamily III